MSGADEQRRRFEEWAIRRGYAYTYDGEIGWNEDSNVMWETWQAAQATCEPEPTVGDAERLIKKMELCDGMAVKIILLKGFIAKHAKSSKLHAQAADLEEIARKISEAAHKAFVYVPIEPFTPDRVLQILREALECK